MTARREQQIDALDEKMVAVFRSMSGAERLRVANGMFSSARRMLRSHLSALHPDWTEAQIDREVASRISLGTG